MVMSTIEDIKDWVKTERHALSLIISGTDYLEFHDGRHYYRMIGNDSWTTDVALMEGFNRWGPDSIYHMDQLPCSRESLMKLVAVCNCLSDSRARHNDEALDIRPLMCVIAPPQ